MEKNCLVTQLKGKTGNTDLPVLGFIKIKISRISELNEDAWNIFYFHPIDGKNVTVKILGDGLMYTSKENRASNTNGVKSVTLSNPGVFYFSNGDYEILIEKYTVKSISSAYNLIRCDNIHLDYDTFKNSNLSRLDLMFIKEYVTSNKLNITGSIRNLPSSITELRIYGNSENQVNLEDFSTFAANLSKLTIDAENGSYGSFDSVKFPLVLENFAVAYCGFSGNLKNVPVRINDSQNYGKCYFTGDVQESIERLAKNSNISKDVSFYFGRDLDKVYWRDTSLKTFPEPGLIFLTLNGTGGVTVYRDRARTDLLGTFDGTSWSYPS